MAFEGYALYPPLTIRDNIGFALLRERRPGGGRRAGRGGAGAARDRGHPRPLPAHHLGRAAAAHQPRPRAGPPRADLAARRAHVAARAAAPRHPARPDQGLPDRAQDDDGVRHPRPDRGDRARRPDRGHGAGRAAAVRPPAALKERAGQPVRRELHRRAADEHPRRRRGPEGAAGPGLGSAPRTEDRLPVPLAARWRPRRRARRRRPAARHPPASRAGRRPARAGGDRVSNQWLGDQTHLGARSRRLLPRRGRGRRRSRRRSASEVAVGLPLAAMHLFDAESGKALVHGLDAGEAAAA